MKNNRNSISHNMIFPMIIWRLSSFISIFLILVASPLFASESPSFENFVHANPVIETGQKEQPQNHSIHISEGTVIIGLESISQSTDIKYSEQDKVIQKVSKKKK